MKFNHATAYALKALVHLAQHGDGRPVASHDIAAAHGIPERFLLKVLKPLVDAGLLRSLKGPNGGYRLAKPARDITLLEVVEAAEAPVRLAPTRRPVMVGWLRLNHWFGGAGGDSNGCHPVAV